MDILTESEISSINRSSELVRKYSSVIDRESAYEILGEKIARLGKEAAREQERKEWEREDRERYPRRTTGRSRRQDPVVKVLTSATFIRGVFGVLRKVL